MAVIEPGVEVHDRSMISVISSVLRSDTVINEQLIRIGSKTSERSIESATIQQSQKNE